MLLSPVLPAYRGTINRFLAPALLLLSLTGCGPAAGPVVRATPQPGPNVQAVRLDSAEARRLTREARQEVAITIATGLELSLWAPEPLLAGPSALSIDDQGRVYVTQTVRSGETGLDLRRWFDRDRATRARAASYAKELQRSGAPPSRPQRQPAPGHGGRS